MDYVTPEFSKDAFNCPYCNAYAHMNWHNLFSINQGGFSNSSVFQAKCQRCGETSIWLSLLKPEDIVAQASLPKGQSAGEMEHSERAGLMLHPLSAKAPMPSLDLPEDCKKDYLEARAIEAQSPRAAAALLRLVVQKLCKHFGESGKDINTDIMNLVKKGLSVQLQQALDTLRVIGNEAVHPGEIDLNDNQQITSSLFGLINLIVRKMITEPKEFLALYNDLPQQKLGAILQRDKPKQ